MRIDQAAATREAHLDGKRLLRTSDRTLTPEDLTAASKQLTAVERGWRDCKGSQGPRPAYHHREDRIRAHVQLCGLAPAHPGRRDHHRRRVAQRSATTSGQKAILDALQLHEPPTYLDFTTSS